MVKNQKRIVESWHILIK